MDVIGERIHQLAEEQGVNSFATEYGTAFKKSKDWVKVSNWDAALDFILANDLQHMLTRSVKKDAAKEFMAENNNSLPPGLEYGKLVEIAVRRK